MAGSSLAGALRAVLPVSSAMRGLKARLLDEILPFWLESGWDERRGGFYERMFLDGTPDRLSLRPTLTQFRQISAMALGAELGWRDGYRLALRGLEYMLERAWAVDGAPGFVHSLAPDGAPVDLRRDAGDHAAAILAMVSLAQLSGDAQVAGLLRLLLSYVEDALHDADGLLKPEARGAHAQGCAWGCIELMAAQLDAHARLALPSALLRAARYCGLVEPLLGELGGGGADEPQRASGEGRPGAEAPGRMAQAAGVIRRYERLAGLAPGPLATRLLEEALLARAPATGFLIERSVADSGLREGHSRLGTQCALMHAWLEQASAGFAEASDAGEVLLERICTHFLVPPFRGGWIDRLDAQGRPAIDTVPAAALAALVALALAGEPG